MSQLVAQDEKRLFDEGFKHAPSTLIVGVDEAGRGPLAGPVVAAAVVITDFDRLPFIDDSKKLTPKKRKSLFSELMSLDHVHVGISVIDEATIDEINIFQATLKGMSEAIAKLSIRADIALIDGKFCPPLSIEAHPIIKGDSRSLSIGAASIIAKEYRDELMLELDKKWPLYGFSKHKGYGTALHLEKLREHGPCPCHRQSFAPVKALSGGNY